MTQTGRRRAAIERMERNLSELFASARQYSDAVHGWQRINQETELARAARKYSRSVETVRRT